MKLSELIEFKNQLDSVSIVEEVRTTANQQIDKIAYLINQHSSVYPTDFAVLQNELFQHYNKLQQSLDNIKAQVKKDIEVAEKYWFQESYELYNGELSSTADTILNLRSNNSTDIAVYQSRLRVHANWRHPAMIIRPGKEPFIQDMTMFDPLYLVDLNHDFLLPALTRFNESYQGKLRTYSIKEELDYPILQQLPDTQFGLVLAYNYFNFRPFEILKKYFSEVFNKLKPGGLFIFTFNDCDRASAVKLVENYYCCYTPGYLVKELAQSMGFEIEYSYNDHGPVTWLELKKPGILSSIKGGQTFSKLV